MKEEKEVKQENELKWWVGLGFACVLLTFGIVFASYVFVLGENAKLEYLSSLTPAEREEIQQQEQLEKERIEAESDKFWGVFRQGVEIPLWIVLLFGGYCAYKLWYWVFRRSDW